MLSLKARDGLDIPLTSLFTKTLNTALQNVFDTSEIVQFLKPQCLHVCETLRTFPISLAPTEPLLDTWNHGYLCCTVGSTHILYKTVWSFWGQVPDVIITSGEVISTKYWHNQRQGHVPGHLPSSAWCLLWTWTVKLPTWCITMST